MEIYSPFELISDYLGLNFIDTKINTLYSDSIARLQDIYKYGYYDLIEYGDPITQAGYLIYYYPIYTLQIDDIMKAAGICNLFDSIKSEVNICIYGGGPIPEVIGILKYFRESLPRATNFNIYICDCANWSRFREHLADYIKYEFFEDFKIKFYEKILDIQTFAEGIEESDIQWIENGDIHIIQNCGTDIIHANGGDFEFINIIKNIVNASAINSFIIICDPVVFNKPINNPFINIRKTLATLFDEFKGKYSMLLERPYNRRTSLLRFKIPLNIKNNFDSKNTAVYHSVVIHKT